MERDEGREREVGACLGARGGHAAGRGDAGGGGDRDCPDCEVGLRNGVLVRVLADFDGRALQQVGYLVERC